MNYRAGFLCALSLFAPAAVCAQTAQTASPRTPAENRIAESEREIGGQPGQSQYYNHLAAAYAQRAAETADTGYDAKAQEALQQSFKLEPGNFEGLKIEVLLLLGRHEFAKALEEATALHERVPDDLAVHGYLADANTELGNYAEAVKEAQWMLNLRPGNAPGLTRAAILRELHGDVPGASEWMRKAYDSTPPEEIAERASLLRRMAHLQLLAGNAPQAESYANIALGLLSDYPDALRVLAEARLAQGGNEEAVALLEKLCATAPRAGNTYVLAKALERAGKKDAASQAYSEFEKKALQEQNLAGNANHELAAYYADYANQPAKALQIATAELARRHDAFTLDAYAWALEACGDYVQAAAEMAKALAFGIRDPEVLRHAGEIAKHRPADASR